MPAAEYELGRTLDPLIDGVVAELKSNGWNASKGVRYGIPYIRIRRTGFFYTIEFDNHRFIPQIENLPTTFVPKIKKYWCWSALIDEENPNTTGFLHYDDPSYYLRHRGSITGLGTQFSHTDLLLCIYILLFDPCLVPNSFAHLNEKSPAASVCPVCTPPKEFKKVIADGLIPDEYLKLFSDRNAKDHKETIKLLFTAEPNTLEFDDPVQLSGLSDRFQTEGAHRTSLAIKALQSGEKSEIPEHYLYHRQLLPVGVRHRVWLVPPGTNVAHLGYDTNIGELPDNSIPAIKTHCDEILLKMPKVLDGDFEKNSPCIICFEKSFIYSSDSGVGRRLTDLSWAQETKREFPKKSTYYAFGWGQPIVTPKDTSDKVSWYRSAIQSFGVFLIPLASQINKALGLDDDSEDKKLIHELLGKEHPAGFDCLLCGNKRPLADLCEEFATPSGTSKSNFLISPGSVVRLGPKTLCSECRSRTYGTDYPDMGKSEEVLQALNDYKIHTGVIPDLDWRRRPILRDLPSGLTQDECKKAILKSVDISIRMPSGFRSVKSKFGGSDVWEEDPTNWWELLYRAGLVGKFKETPRGKQAVSEDGHLCLSMLEWKFCNFLHSNGIEHTKEPRYSKSNQTRADYMIGSLFVEIAGLLGDPVYEEKLLKKLDNARESKQRVLVLSPRDVEQIIQFKSFSESSLENFWSRRVEEGHMSARAHS